MAKAYLSSTLIAESNNTIVVEGNHYFPPGDVKTEHLEATDYRTQCPWKGEAHYYNVVIGDDISRTAAWSYPEPKEKAKYITGHYAFWKGVSIEE